MTNYIFLIFLLLTFSVCGQTRISLKDSISIVKVLKFQEDAWNEGNINKFMEGYLKSEKIKYIKSGNKNKNLFVAFIERSSHPVNFNYVEYLLNIKLLSSGKRCLIIILPESNIKKIYQKNNFIKNSNEIRYETILKPIIDLIDDFNPSVLTFNNRIDASSKGNR